MYILCQALKGASQAAQWYRIHLPMQEMQEMQIQSLGQEDPLEWEMATHSSTLAWKIPWTEEQSTGLQSQAHGAQQRYIIPCYHLLPVWRVTQAIPFELWIFTYLPLMILCD